MGKPGRKQLTDRNAEVVKLYEAGKTQDQIAKAVGISKTTVGNVVYRHHERLRMTKKRVNKQKNAAYRYGDGATPEDLAKYAAMPRCKCGVLLPCLSCLPPISFYATRSTGWTPSEGSG
jgi:hypothetical protein